MFDLLYEEVRVACEQSNIESLEMLEEIAARTYRRLLILCAAIIASLAKTIAAYKDIILQFCS